MTVAAALHPHPSHQLPEMQARETGHFTGASTVNSNNAKIRFISHPHGQGQKRPQDIQNNHW